MIQFDYNQLVTRKAFTARPVFWYTYFFARSIWWWNWYLVSSSAEVDTADNFGEIGGSISALDLTVHVIRGSHVR